MSKFSVPDSSTEIPNENGNSLVTNSVLYKEFLAEREEILRHKWIESEKAGQDIGFEKALLDWIVKFRSSWRDKRKDFVRAAQTPPPVPNAAPAPPPLPKNNSQES
jgi:hypothetical protein